MDYRIVIIAVGVAILAVVGYVIVMRIFYRDSKALDEKVDLTRMREWKDED